MENQEKISNILEELRKYRVDVKNFGAETNRVEIEAENVSVSEPNWFVSEQGKGKVLQGSDMKSLIKIKAVGNGSLKFVFHGPDRRFEGKRYATWIDYKSIKINGEEILSLPVATWHDKLYRYETEVKDGQEIILEVEQQYHKYSEDELKDVLEKLYPQFGQMKEFMEYYEKNIGFKNVLPTLRVNITDIYNGYNKTNNIFINTFKKHYNVEFSKTPDFLIYSCFGIEHLKYKNCVKIFFTGENVLPDFNECDYATGFDYIDFSDRYFRKNYIVPHKNICDRSMVDESYFNRKFCNFIYSNSGSGEGAALRLEFCKKLMKYKQVDCPGRVLNNMTAEDLEPRNGDWIKSKLEFLKKYKFTIAFENSSSNGYTTEKLFQPFQSFSIPIYWGNPLVAKDFNPKAFINCNDYDNDFDAVIERVKELDNDPDKYLAMLRENPMQSDFDFEQGKKIEKWLLDIVKKGNKPFNKDPHGKSSAAIFEKELKKLVSNYG